MWKLEDKPVVDTGLKGRMVTTRLTLAKLPTRDEIQDRLKTATERFEIERLDRALARRILVGDGSDYPFFFTVWRLGEAFVVSTPSEAYSKFQVDLRALFPGAAVAVLNATDGSTSYLPLAESFNRDVYQSRVAIYGPGSLERVTELAASAVRDLR